MEKPASGPARPFPITQSEPKPWYPMSPQMPNPMTERIQQCLNRSNHPSGARLLMLDQPHAALSKTCGKLPQVPHTVSVTAVTGRSIFWNYFFLRNQGHCARPAAGGSGHALHTNETCLAALARAGAPAGALQREPPKPTFVQRFLKQPSLVQRPGRASMRVVRNGSTCVSSHVESALPHPSAFSAACTAGRATTRALCAASSGQRARSRSKNLSQFITVNR